MRTYNVVFKKKPTTDATSTASTASPCTSSILPGNSVCSAAEPQKLQDGHALCLSIDSFSCSSDTVLADNICCGAPQQQPQVHSSSTAWSDTSKRSDDPSTTFDGARRTEGTLAAQQPAQQDQQGDANKKHDPQDEASELSALAPPLERYKKHNKLSVTDLSSQIWCETQLNFVLSTGRRRQTQAMLSGIQRHEVLEKADHDVVDVEVETNEESLGLRLLNSCILLEQLFLKKVVREVWIFGIVDGVMFRGVIDELEIKSAEPPRSRPVPNPSSSHLRPVVSSCSSSSTFLSATPPFPPHFYTVISDTKTRRQPREPSLAQKRTSAIQLQLYCYMLTELQRGNVDFELLFDIYKCDQDYNFTIPELAEYTNLRTLSQYFISQVMNLPEIKHEMEIVYECDGTEFARNNPVQRNEHPLRRTRPLAVVER
eukprot:GHVS01059017.1.p1 GENE.GHVS01059017.1~~GHVS01059017.1.p1  ORF type:complete len:428 (+),score=57.58 GHVS01059017.1:456-1739(+)